MKPKGNRVQGSPNTQIDSSTRHTNHYNTAEPTATHSQAWLFCLVALVAAAFFFGLGWFMRDSVCNDDHRDRVVAE